MCISPHIYVSLFAYLAQAAQIAVAMLGFTYSIDSVDQIALVVEGPVAVPNMTSIQTGLIVKSNSRALGALEYTANRLIPSSI